MYDKPNEIPREALYALVWSKPMREVAPSLNLSDTGLAKLCKRYHIPRPRQGHWLSLQHSGTVNQPPLPDTPKGMPTTIQLPRIKFAAAPSQPNTPLPTISEKTTTHAVIKQCRTHFKGAAVNNYGRLVSPHRTDVDVSRSAYPRALSLLNTVIHTAEGLGHAVSYSNKQRAIVLNIDGECLCLSINETATRTDRILTPDQKHTKDVYGYVAGGLWDYTPSGKLTLSVNARGLYGRQSSWKDAKRTALESNLPKVMVGILSCANRLAALRIEESERERRYAINQLRRERIERVITLRQQRIESVERMVMGFQRAQAIRDCLADVRESAETLTAGDKRQHRWAAQLARHYDPVDAFSLPRYRLEPDAKTSWSL